MIRRYKINRRLYCTEANGYVTLAQLAVRIRNGEVLQVVTSEDEDHTAQTYAAILLEMVIARPTRIPAADLAILIQRFGADKK